MDLVGIVGLSRSLNRVAKDWGSGKRGRGRMEDEEICNQNAFMYFCDDVKRK